MNKQLVLLGAGHAHLMVVRHIRDFLAGGCQVTVVSPSPWHYYSGMGPGMLSGIYRPEEVRFPVRDMVQERGGVFLEDWAVAIDPGRKIVRLESGRSLAYDVLSVNVGSRVPMDMITGSTDGLFPVKPIENLLLARERILTALARGGMWIVVVGGGPAGLETAGNVWRLARQFPGSSCAITLAAGSRLLPRCPERVRDLARASLVQRGINILEGSRARSIHDRTVTLDDGSRLESDVLLLTVGITPPALFRDSGLPVGPDGGLAVNRFLQCPDHPEIFGGGDCVHFMDHPLPKVGVYAVRQNPVLLRNLTAFLEGRPLTPFNPQPAYLLIFNLGDGRGIFWRKGLVFDGPLAFWIKDRIDRRFMARFRK